MRLWWWLLAVVRLAVTAAATPGASSTEPAREWSFCMAELGCVNTTEEWYHSVRRPHNPLPNKRHVIKTTFVLHRRGARRDGETFAATPASILAAGFNATFGTTIIIHDFTSNGYSGWVRRLAEALLHRSQRNVVAVDWGAGARPPLAQAASNARVVALEVVHLLHELQQDFGAVHLVGHGLGAHVAAYVGAALHGIGRLTGLDPTGPLFEGMPIAVRLDASDASFVDVIHTDARSGHGHGTSQASGHVDFFPNGGRQQPGCEDLDASAKGGPQGPASDTLAPGAVLPACSHKRAYKYYTESLESGEEEGSCHFIGFQCKDYESFAAGKCLTCEVAHGGHCVAMGAGATVPGTGGVDGRPLFLRTLDAAPFCAFAYRVELALARPKGAKAHVTGDLSLSLLSRSPPDRPPITLRDLVPHGRAAPLAHGETAALPLVMHGPPRVADAAKAQVAWHYRSSLKSPSTVCMLCDNSLYVERVVVTVLPAAPDGAASVRALCSCDGQPFAGVKSNTSHVFVPCEQPPSPLPPPDAGHGAHPRA